jgi:hypothetical protein
VAATPRRVTTTKAAAVSLSQGNSGGGGGRNVIDLREHRSFVLSGDDCVRQLWEIKQ